MRGLTKNGNISVGIGYGTDRLFMGIWEISFTLER